MYISKQRLEALSDGIIAIIITILALSIPLPNTFNRIEIFNLTFNLGIYFLSFFMVGVFWSQHQNLFNSITEVSFKLTVYNVLFLFTLSLIPTFTKWVMLYHDNRIPAIFYTITYALTSTSFMFMYATITDTISKSIQCSGKRCSLKINCDLL